MKSADFSVRALELHSLYTWDFSWVNKVMGYIEDLGYNTLIIHRNDIVESLEYPGSIFGYNDKKHDVSIFDVYSQCYKTIFRNTPTRRSSIFNKRAYFKRLLTQAGKKGIAVYIENKELYFPDILPELKPELIRDGHVCPTDPYWKDYIKIKFTEFFRDYPEVKGLITSVSTSESKISIKNNRCHCERCKQTTPEAWYRVLLTAMHDVLSEFGKEFIVRDFVFDASSQKEIATVMEELPSDVIISLKNTPHDYYPTFPINPRIGNVGNHRQWVEFDTMGQYFGMGIGVADLTQDYRRRLKDAKAKGVDGVIFRTDWESMDGHSSFVTPNLINVYSAAMLSIDIDMESDAIYRCFAEREGWNATDLEGTSQWLQSILEKTWSVTSKSVFADGCVFSDSSTLPISMHHAIWLAEEKNSLKDWDASKSDSISPMKSSLQNIIREKDLALQELDAILKVSDAIPSCVPNEKGMWLKDWMHINRLYLQEFSLVAKAILTARYILESREEDQIFKEICSSQFHDYLLQLEDMEKSLRSFWKDTDHKEHVIYTLLDPDRIECLRYDLSSYGI